MQIHSVCTNEKSTILLVVSQKAAKERMQLERELKASHMQKIIGRFSLDTHRQDDCFGFMVFAPRMFIDASQH